MATKFSVTLTAQGISVPMDVTTAELRASLLGGRNYSGELVSGGWDDAICAECGESAAWCTKLTKALSGRSSVERFVSGVEWVDARRSA